MDRLPETLVLSWAAAVMLLLLWACYSNATALPPCSAAETACGGYPGEVVIVERAGLDGGTRDR